MTYSEIIQTAALGTDKRSSTHIPPLSVLRSFVPYHLAHKAAVKHVLIDILPTPETGGLDLSGDCEAWFQVTDEPLLLVSLCQMVNGLHGLVHPGFLPNLLDLAMSSAAACKQITPVLGKRGHWLAEHHPLWRVLTGSLSYSAWRALDTPQQLTFLQVSFALHPLQAQEWCQKMSTTAEKVSAIAAMPGHLRELEIEQLEQWLTDDSKVVKQKAALALLRVQHHAYANILRDFMTACTLGVADPPIRPSSELAYSLFASSFLAEIFADPIDAYHQVAAHLHPDKWLHAESVVDKITHSGNADFWIDILCRATTANDASRWATLLLSHLTIRSLSEEQVLSLIACLSLPDFSLLMVELLQRTTSLPPHRSIFRMLLNSISHPWDQKWSTRMLQQCQRWITNEIPVWESANYADLLKTVICKAEVTVLVAEEPAVRTMAYLLPAHTLNLERTLDCKLTLYQCLRLS